MQNYPVTREWDDADWLDPLLTYYIWVQCSAVQCNSLHCTSVRPHCRNISFLNSSQLTGGDARTPKGSEHTSVRSLHSILYSILYTLYFTLYSTLYTLLYTLHSIHQWGLYTLYWTHFCSANTGEIETAQFNPYCIVKSKHYTLI